MSAFWSLQSPQPGEKLTDAQHVPYDTYMLHLAVVLTPTKALRPLGLIFLFIVSFAWPAYYYIRACYRSFLDGLAGQICFKLAGVSLLVYVIYSATGGALFTGKVNCRSYVAAEFRFLVIAVFGYIALMLCLRSVRAEDRLTKAVGRDDWPVVLRYTDGILAILVELITIPWVLEGFREAFSLPRSPVIDWGLRLSNRILANTLGRFIGEHLGSGQNFLESGFGHVNKAFTGHLGSMLCPGDVSNSISFNLFVMTGIAILLLPVVVVVSFEPLIFFLYEPTVSYSSTGKQCDRCKGNRTLSFHEPFLMGALCPRCSGSGHETPKGWDNPFTLLGRAISRGIGLVIAWPLLLLIFGIIGIATGVH